MSAGIVHPGAKEARASGTTPSRASSDPNLEDGRGNPAFMLSDADAMAAELERTRRRLLAASAG